LTVVKARGATLRHKLGKGLGRPLRGCAWCAEPAEGGSMRSDEDVKLDVEQTLRSTPGIDATDVAVAVRNGIVMLTGFARNEIEKHQAEKLAKRVEGVLGLANDIAAHPRGGDVRPDPDIARDAVAAIRTRLPRSWDRIRVVVQLGWITLEGEVERHYQRETAEDAMRGIKDARGVNNLIRVWSKSVPSEAKRDIEKAFRRSVAAHVNRITLETTGETILGGTVRSWSERQEAQRAS
jgi:osmotically-inducible protein OsmY